MACRGAFTTFVSGAAYVPGVQCLRVSATRSGSTCPWVVVYDDRVRVAMPRGAITALASGMRPGIDELIPLTSLYAKLHNHLAHAYIGVDICNDSAVVGEHEGRRLYEKSEYLTPWLKLWLWALDKHEHLVYVDADSTFQSNVDELLRQPPPVAHEGDGRRNSSRAPSLYAMAAASCPRQAAFNSGVMLFRPSSHSLRDLQGLASRWLQQMLASKSFKPKKVSMCRVLLHTHEHTTSMCMLGCPECLHA